MGACWSHPLRNDVTNGCVPHKLGEYWDAPVNEENLPAWDAITSSMIVWDYATNFDNYDAYFPNLNVLLDNVQFFAENGVIGVFEQECYPDTADFKELRRYIISKILWDPFMSEEEYWAHVDDFLEGFYGPGWENIRAYIDMTEELAEEVCYCLYENFADESLYFSITATEKNPDGTYPSDLTADMIRNYTEVDWTKYLSWYKGLEDSVYLEKGAEYFAAALEKAETDEQRARIEKAALQVEFVESSYKFLQLRFGKSGYSKLIGAYMDAHPDEFTADEKSTLKTAAYKYARAQAEEAYVEFNKALRDKLLAHGITTIREARGDITNVDRLNFANIPCNWYS